MLESKKKSVNLLFKKGQKMWSNLNDKLLGFATIDLKELNATASYLKRIDTKYLLTENKLKNILEDLKSDFLVLDIKGRRIFSYDNVYMDTNDYLFYNQHQNKESSRTKVRTRLYKDSDLAFFEYKQKQGWITKKFRYQFPQEEHWTITKGKKRFFEWVWQSLYSDTEIPQITPSIKTMYNRLTLVSKNWEERLTIDFNIKIKDLRNEKAKEINLKNLVIVESKSMKKVCDSWKIMERHSIKRRKSCSKYSLWVIYSWLAEKWSTFAQTMKKIKEIRLEVIKKRERNKSAKKVEKVIENKFKKTSLRKIEAGI